MTASHCTSADLVRALALVNRYYNGNLRFRRLEPRGRRVLFTLGVVSTRTRRTPAGRAAGDPAPGVRWDFRFRRLLAAACWHAHGHFFEALFTVAPAARVVSSFTGGRRIITRDGGNWQDARIGSVWEPVMFSEACACSPEADLEISRALDPVVAAALT